MICRRVIEARINRALDWYFDRRAARARGVGAAAFINNTPVENDGAFIAVSYLPLADGWPSVPRVESMRERCIVCDILTPLQFAMTFKYREAGRLLREAFEDGRLDAEEYGRACKSVLEYHLLRVEEAKRRQREREGGVVEPFVAL